MDIYLCDDNLVQLAELKRMIDESVSETDRVYTCTNGKALLQMLSDGDTENACVISDIELEQDGEGLRLAREINQYYPRIPIILCTAYLHYAKELWDVDLSSFLSKPIGSDALRHTLEKARRLLERDVLSVTYRGNLCRVIKRDIRYIERKGRTSFLYLAASDPPVQTGEVLDQLYKRLDSRAFCKIHRGYLINLEYVEHVRGEELKLRGVDIILTVSRSWRKHFIQALADYEGAKWNESV